MNAIITLFLGLNALLIITPSVHADSIINTKANQIMNNNLPPHAINNSPAIANLFNDPFDSSSVDLNKWVPGATWEEDGVLTVDGVDIPSIYSGTYLGHSKKTFDDFDMTVEFKILDKGTWQTRAADIILRENDSNGYYNYYSIQLVKNSNGSHIMINPVVNNGTIPGKQANISLDKDIELNKWNSFRVIAEGNSFTFYMDETQVGGWTDQDNFYTSGAIGFSAYGTASQFRNLQILY